MYRSISKVVENIAYGKPYENLKKEEKLARLDILSMDKLFSYVVLKNN